MKKNPNSLVKFSDCTALVIWGTDLGCTVGERFTRTQLAMVKRPWHHPWCHGWINSF